MEQGLYPIPLPHKDKKLVLGNISYKALDWRKEPTEPQAGKCVGKVPEGKPYTGSRTLEEDIQLGKQRKVACTSKGSEKTRRGSREMVAGSQAPGN